MAATYEVHPAFFFILCVVFSTYASKLNVPKVLLPYYSSVATNSTLYLSEGCYIWRSSRPEVATVFPVGTSDPTRCARQAIVTAVSKTPVRVTSVVTAEDPVSGQLLRCDVIVDVIHSIEIETTTRELYLEDSPEEFSVRALDDEGNTFSSLDGVSFEWSLLSDTDVDRENIVDAHNVIRILPFFESSYKTPSHIKMLEKRGLQGNMILVEGIKTGSAKVSVTLRDPVYKKVKTSMVRLIVIANIMLNPPVVYLWKHMQVEYKVQLVKQGKIHEIPMPSQQYYLDLKDPTIGSLDVKTSTLTALQLGHTEIVLKDRNIKVKEAFRQPSAAIYVVTPGYLGFVVLPGRKWVLETDRIYDILIEIYDKDSHKMYPADNIRVVAQFPEQYFEVQYSSLNGTYHIVKTLKKGTTDIEGLLRAVIAQDGKEIPISPTLKNSQDVEIYDPIQVSPPILVFPWDPVHKALYQYTLKATGGSGNYTWSSSDQKVAGVTVKGEIHTHTIGQATITAASVLNSAHTGTMKVFVVPPSDMEFVPSQVEAETGTTLELPLAVYGRHGKDLERKLFADCRHLPFKIHIADTSVFSHVPETAPLKDGSCTTIKVHAHKLGYTEITAEYEQENIKLLARTTIAAYKPLKPIDPEHTAVVTVGSSKEVTFEGGPQPWVLDTSQYFQEVVAEKPDILSMTHLKAYGQQRNLHIFHVSCRDLGEQILAVNVGNGPSAQNKFPAKSHSHIKFACAHPVGLHLAPVVKHPGSGLPPCPIRQESESIPVYSNKDLDIVVTVTDSQGRKFDNFSSLAIDWYISDQSLASFDKESQLTTEIIPAETGRNIMKCLRTLMMKHKLGSLTVTASVQYYSQPHFHQQQIKFERTLKPPISQSLELMLVEHATISPELISIFNHPSNRATLKISKGSGHFFIDTGDTKIAKTTYDQKSRALQVTPIQDGSFTITAYDLCLETDQDAEATIHISGVNFIEVKVLDKVELNTEIKAHVRVLDRNGQPLLASYFPLMNLKSSIRSDIITVRPDPVKSEDAFTAVYIVRGAALGHTTLTFVASPKYNDAISSQPKDIQVFPPLRLQPRNITVIIGAVFQVTAHGGPQPQSTIEYSIVDHSIATVANSGLVDAVKIGHTTIVGKAVGYDGETGHTVVYSEDQVTVYVVQLEGIRIYAPLKRVQTHTQMPVYAVGLNEHETPFTFGSTFPPLSFRWSVNNKDVASLKSVYYKIISPRGAIAHEASAEYAIAPRGLMICNSTCGIKIPDESNFAMRLFAKQAGHVTVRLTAIPSDDSRLQVRGNAIMTDEVQIQVFEQLRLMSPEICDGRLILTPNTETNVRTNRDGSAKLAYRVIDRDGDEGSTKPVISVSEVGHVVSGPVTGQASLLITAHEDFGVNQSMVVQVKVKPVSYLMLNSDTAIRTSGSSLASIPVGTTLHFTVSFHDDVGDKFFTTNTLLKYRPHRYDLIHVSPAQENGTLVARTTGVGQTILKVWDGNNPRIADYISIDIGYAIQPAQAQVTLGDVVCFSSPVLSSSGHRGTWSSSSHVVVVHADSGVGTASQIGHTLIHYSVNNPVVTYTEVSVVPVSKVSLRNDHVQFLTNVPGRNKASVLPVVLEGSQGHSDTNLVGTNCSEIVASSGYTVPYLPFRCELKMSAQHPDIDIDDLLRVTAEFDAHLGQYQCTVTQTAPQDLGQLVSTLDMFVQLRAIIPEQERQQEVSSEVVSLPFRPAFYIHTPEVQVSNLLPTTTIRISAIDRVFQSIKVSTSDSSIIEVQPPEKDSQSEQVMHYPIKLLERPALWELDKVDATLEVVCMATGQKQSVPVRVKLMGQRPEHLKTDASKTLFQIIANNYQSWLFMILCIIGTLSAIFIAYHAVLGPRYHTAGPQSGSFQVPPGQHSPGFTPATYQPSPWNSPYGTSVSPSKVPLWTSGYDLQDTSGVLHRRTSPRLSPYQ